MYGRSSDQLGQLKSRQAAWRAQHDDLMERRAAARKAAGARQCPSISGLRPATTQPRRRELANPLLDRAAGVVPGMPSLGADLNAFASPVRMPQPRRRRLSSVPDQGFANSADQVFKTLVDEVEEKVFEQPFDTSDVDSIGARNRKRAETERSDKPTSFEMCLTLSKKHNRSAYAVKQQLDVFVKFDLDRDGILSKDEFEHAVRHLCHLADDGEPIPRRILGPITEDVKFEDFLLWTFTHAFVEDIFCVDETDKQLRKLARDNEWSLWDVEQVKKTFDSYDTDHTGSLDLEHFGAVLRNVLGAKSPADLSRSTLTRYFREVDIDGGGDIDFEEFALWWFNRGVLNAD